MDEWNRKIRTLYTWSHLYLGFKVAQVRSRMLPEQQRAEFWKKRHSKFAQALWSGISDLRGWWVKVGQFLSTRADLLPDEYVAELAKVQDMMPTSSFEKIRDIVETELQGKLEDIFEWFDPKALASASIGQVHRACLKENQELVVVKVQHPDVDRLLLQDMSLLTQLSWAFGLLERGLNFTSVLDEWQKQASLELDFRYEMTNQARVRDVMIAAKIPVKVPLPYPQYTTKKVMVMEFIDGFKVTDQTCLKKYNVDIDKLCIDITRSFAHQIHIDGLFNGDPHPGNILVEIDKETGRVIPVLIDWGLVKEFNKKERLAFARTIVAVANLDVMKLMEAFQDMGFKFKRPNNPADRKKKGDLSEASPIPIDPELYMDAIAVVFSTKPSESGKSQSTVGLSDKDRKKLWQASKEPNARAKASELRQQNPLDDWPKDIIFFLRVASLLHGLSVQLKAKVPFFQIMLEKAEMAIRLDGMSPAALAHFALNPRAGANTPSESLPAADLSLRYSSRLGVVRSGLEWQIHKMCSLWCARGEILGCQVAVWHRRSLVVDVGVGRMGAYDGRPVTSRTLFTAFSLTNVLLVTMLLSLVDSGKIKLTDCVSEWWDQFIRGGKRDITVEQILTHQSGVHNWLPSNLTLSQITNIRYMVHCAEQCIPKCRAGRCGHYSFYCSSFLLFELVKCVSKMSPSRFFKSVLLKQWKLKHLSKNLFFPVPARLIGAYKRFQSQLSAEQDLLNVISTQVPNDNDAPTSAPPKQRAASDNALASPNSLDQQDVFKLQQNASAEYNPSLTAEFGTSPANAKNELRPKVFGAISLRGENPRSPEASTEGRGILRVRTPEGAKAVEKTATSPLLAASIDASVPPGTTDFSATPDLLDSIPGEGASRYSGGESSSPASIVEEIQTPEIKSASTRPLPRLEAALSDDEIHQDLLKTSALEIPSGLVALKSRQHLATSFSTASLRYQESRWGRIRRDTNRGASYAPSQTFRNFESSPPDGRGSLHAADRTIMTAMDVVSRMAGSRRDFGLAKLADATNMRVQAASEEEKNQPPPTEEELRELDCKSWLQTLQAAKSEEAGYCSLVQVEEVLSKYKVREKDAQAYLREKEIEESKIAALMAKIEAESYGMSALELMKARPHLLDPLLFDSKDVVPIDIPCCNARVTARALATLMHQVGRGVIIGPALLRNAMTPRTYDESLEGRIGCGGLPPLFGLGYQILPVQLVESKMELRAHDRGLGPARSIRKVIGGQRFSISEVLQATVATPPASLALCCRPSPDTALSRELCEDLPRFIWTKPQVCKVASATVNCGVRATVGSAGPATRACARAPEVRRKEAPVKHYSSVKFDFAEMPGRSQSSPKQARNATFHGIGGSDIYGNTVFTFPDLELTIAITVNDVISGSTITESILKHVLYSFGVMYESSPTINPVQ